MEPFVILIVEDEDIVAADIQEALESFGYTVCGRAATGDDAVRLAAENHPNLVLMDIKLEGEMDGIQASAAIKESLRIPVVFLTAYADDETLARAKVTDPYGYILKPFKEMELKMAVELALYKFSSEEKGGIAQASAVTEEVELTPKKKKISDFLMRVDPFSNANRASIDKLASLSRVTEHKASDLIVFEGDESVSGFVVLSGRVSMLKGSPNGKELIVELLPPGDPFGLLASFDKHPYSVSVKAQVDSELLWIPRNEVLLFLEKQPELGKRFIGEVFSRLRRSHDFSRALAHDRVETRIAHALVSIVPKFSANEDLRSQSLAIEMSRQEMSELVGTTPETVIRTMKMMEREGLIDLSDTGYVKVLDLDSLTELSEC